ncbi:molybdopterin-containing oxidoreductase family protein [Maridesulfovibrio frigidus]|uniref:molybdopterin-containing oxidoreductase family protein n=1 Tax=Maridesulfovibrio frigidus TaxID=340956 RepID=UPI0004E0B719|nr:molybdopterin-dependent oxidoreductase [Maridesulfovibrio frigidus]
MQPPFVPTICRICKENCGLLVSETDGETQIDGNPEHPVSRGFICSRGKKYGYVRHSPDRLKTPLLRKNGKLVPITFDQAMDVLAEKFAESRDQYGPESICLYKGESLKHQEVAAYMKHLAHGLGSPNYISVGSLCHASMAMGHGMTYGGIPEPDFSRMKSALIWGANPAISSPRTYKDIKKAVTDGVRLVVVDPSQTKTAKMADIHLQIKAGTDGFLALAFLKLAIENAKLVPSSEAIGFEDLRAMLEGISLNEAVNKTGLELETVKAAWEILYANRPVWVQTGLGLELKPTGVQTIRAIACLQSLLDDVRPKSSAVKLAPLPGMDKYPARPRSIGTHEAPMYTGGDTQGQGMFWGKAILEGDPYPLRSMLIMGGNPMLTFPDEDAQRKALSKLDFLAVFDLFMTPTAELADLIIPAADMLETLEVHDYGTTGRPLLGLVRPVSTESAIGEPAWKVIFTLAERLGLGELFPWKDNREALIWRLSQSGISIEDLEKSSTSTVSYKAEYDEHGPVHYASERLASMGQASMPVPESFILPVEDANEYPFTLSTGDRVSPYQHSQFHNVLEYRKALPDQYLDMHHDAAPAHGIKDGQEIKLSTPYGALNLHVRLCSNVRIDCLRLAHGWIEANANILTGLDHFDPISGFPWLMSLPAKVES